MLKKIDLEKLLFIVLIILSLFMPFRELLALKIHSIVKFIPDCLILVLSIIYFIKNKFKLKFMFIDKIFLAFIIFGLISTIINHISIYNFLIQTRSISIMYILFYLMRKIPLKKNKYIFLVKLNIYISVILSFLAIGECILKKQLIFPQVWANNIQFKVNFVRAYGMLNNPNSFGMYLLLIYYLSLFLKNKNIIKVNWLYYFLIITTIFLTGSRSTFILLLFIILINILNLIKHKQFVEIITIVAIIGLSYSSVYLINYCSNIPLVNNITNKEEKANVTENTPSLNPRFEEMFSGKTAQDSRVNGRIYNIKQGLKIFKNNWLLGTGFGTYGSSGSMIVGSKLENKYNIPKGFYADNEYIKVLVESGILGTIIYITFIALLGLTSLNSQNKTILFCILIFSGLFYNILEVQTIMFLIYLTFIIFEKFTDTYDFLNISNIYDKLKNKCSKLIKSYSKNEKKKINGES